MLPLNKTLFVLLMVPALSACISGSGSETGNNAEIATNSTERARNSAAQPESSGILPVKHDGLERKGMLTAPLSPTMAPLFTIPSFYPISSPTKPLPW